MLETSQKSPLSEAEISVVRTLVPIVGDPQKLQALDKLLKEISKPRKIIVGITGASMPQYGLRTVEVLSENPDVETHLIITENTKLAIKAELGYSEKELNGLLAGLRERVGKDRFYNERGLDAPVSSGSYVSQTEGLLVIPCSVNTLALIANGFDSPLIPRVAQCCFKERKRAVIVFRETPYSPPIQRNLRYSEEAGAIILPPLPAYYHHPQTVEEIIDHTVGKALDLFNIKHDLYQRWGFPERPTQS